MPVPPERVSNQATGPIRPDGHFVLYWMSAYRRSEYNFALERAVEHSKALGKPLLVLEALRVDYPWASDRLHRFALDGMLYNLEVFAKHGVGYYPYVEPRPGAGSGLIEQLSRRACVVVTDDYPCFFLPKALRVARTKLRQLPVALEAVDANGLYPMRATERVFARAVDFRRHLQRELPRHLRQFPRPRPLQGYALGRVELPSEVTRVWPPATRDLLAGKGLAELPIDRTVAAIETQGGMGEARRRCKAFVGQHLAKYDEQRNHPDLSATSGLSKYLHFGHISAHEIFARIAKDYDFSIEQLSARANGSREGFWGLPSSAEAFLDQLVTWRELGFNFCAQRPDYDRFESLPAWALTTLREHASDVRPHAYGIQRLEAGDTHDPVWNAAQRQLLAEGEIHNYLRMLWGKKILEWSASPEQALEYMTVLNNKYAIDGRDPNSYSGIFWVLGRYDRAWGPERRIFGKIRYMSSDNTLRKLRMKAYLERFGNQQKSPL